MIAHTISPALGILKGQPELLSKNMFQRINKQVQTLKFHYSIMGSKYTFLPRIIGLGFFFLLLFVCFEVESYHIDLSSMEFTVY